MMQGSVTKIARIPIWLLFTPYIIVPIILLVIVGNAIGSWGLEKTLPQSPEQIFVLGIIFENPHIVASNLILLDREYLKFYRRDLLIRLGVVAILSALIIVLLGARAFYTVFYGWTIYHVARQQLGIGKMLNRQTSKLYTIWSWLFVAGVLSVALGVGFFKTTQVMISQDVLTVIVLLLTLVVLIAGIICAFTIRRGMGRFFIASNISLLVTSTIAFIAGLPLLAILLPRIVHDTTAFIIYINHDLNRNRPTARHLLYRATAGILPIWSALLMVALLWGGLVTYSGFHWMILFIIAITLAHYATEAFTWRQGSLHRKYLHFQNS